MVQNSSSQTDLTQAESISLDISQKYNLLLLLLNFDKYWSPYSLSDGGLYKEEVKKEGEKIVSLFNQIYGNSTTATLRRDGELITPDGIQQKFEFIQALDSWVNSNNAYPEILPTNSIQNKNKNHFQTALNQFEELLCKELPLSHPISCVTANFEELYHRNVLRWAAQLPDDVISKIDESYINRMSETDTLVVVGDIRRSQDLMTYGHDPNLYRDRILEFMSKTREILKKYCGLYDRFTGDGFIAYFNEYMCESEGKDYYEMMIKSCREIMQFSNPFFEDWSKHLRRIPDTEIGLSIGVDSGRVSFKDLDNQLFAIGDACVWATRMNAAGEKGDVILNNIPYQKLCSSLNKENCTQFGAGTKSGERFSAYRIQVKNVHYSANVIDKKEKNEETEIK